MMKVCFIRCLLWLFLGAAGLTVCAQPRCDRVLRIDPDEPGSLPGKTGYRLVFQDEFNGYLLDSTRWEPSSPGNTRWDCDRGVMSNPANVRVEEGYLHLSVSKDSCQGCPFSQAEVKTFGPAPRFKSYKFLPGSYVEIRAKLPFRANVAGAGWLLYMWLEEQVYREIDIWETHAAYPDRFQSNIHYRPGAGKAYWVCLEDTLGRPVRLDQQFLTFGLDWQKDLIRFYLNGLLCRELRLPKERLWFDWPMDIILGCTAASLNQDSLLEEALPAAMLVDYVRVYWPENRSFLRPLPVPAGLEPQQAFGIRVPPFPHAKYRLEAPGYQIEDLPGDWAQFWWLTPEANVKGSWIKVEVTLETGYREQWLCWPGYSSDWFRQEAFEYGHHAIRKAILNVFRTSMPY